MNKWIALSAVSAAILFGCKEVKKNQEPTVIVKEETQDKIRRFFSDSSFWNTPIPADAATDPRSKEWTDLLATEPTKNGFVVNIEKWTIPVYEVTDNTPKYKIGLHQLSDDEKLNWKTTKETFGHGKAFSEEEIPIPYNASPDRQQDSHMALVDYKNGWAWDMWGLKKNPDGTWQSKTGMKYRLDGSGTFEKEAINPTNGESVHFHGPSRAAGVPAIAGLIMYDEAKRGEINHKLAACTRFSAFQQFTFPAIWTDGVAKNGIPEGATLQLDPSLDLTQFNLLPGELAVAKAAQKYGIVIVDIGGGQALYGEGLWGHEGKSWDGLIRFEGGFSKIPYKHFRVLKIDKTINKGDAKAAHKTPYDL